MARAYAPRILIELYDSLFGALQDAAESADAGFVYKQQSLDSCFKKMHSEKFNMVTITFESYLLLRHWNWRPRRPESRSKSKEIEILVHIQEEFNEEVSQLLRSTVRLTYCLHQDKKLCPLHTIHFDYGPDEVLHPTFHAQFTSSPIVIDEASKKELQCDVEYPATSLDCFGGARIPTADMTFSSVFLCLAADHIGGKFFDDFKSRLNQLQSKIPLPLFAGLKESIHKDPSNLRSSHWFAHHP